MNQHLITSHLKNIALILSIAVVFNDLAFAYQTPDNTRAQTTTSAHTAKVKAEVEQRGTGPNSRVKIKLSNHGGEVKGYVTRIDPSSFQVTEKSGRVTTINYADVDKVRGPGLSTGAKIGIAAGIAAGAILGGIFASLKASGE